MKEIQFDFENIGGLHHCYCIPATSFAGYSLNYLTKRVVLNSVDPTVVVSIPMYADGTYSFTENHGRDAAGDYWQPTVDGIIPKGSLENASLLEELERGEWVVLAVDSNGSVRVCGDADTPLTFSTNTTTGSAPSALNGISFSFSGKLGHPSYVVDFDMDDLS